MKKATLLLAGTLALAACARAAPDTSAADEQKIRADAGVWFEHYNAGDADAIANMYAEDAIVMAPGAPPQVGRAAIRAFIANDIAQSKAAGVTLSQGEINGAGASGDMAWQSSSFTVKDNTGATIETGKYLSLFKRIDGNWMLIRDIWNSDAPATAPATAAPAATTTN